MGHDVTVAWQVLALLVRVRILVPQPSVMEVGLEAAILNEWGCYRGKASPETWCIWTVLLVPTGLFGCLAGTANSYSGTAYRIPFGVVAHHHDIAGVAQRQSAGFPPQICEFDSRPPLHLYI